MATPAVPASRADHHSLLDRIPAAGLVLIAIVGFQLSAVIAKPAIVDAGPIHSTFVRTLLGAILLLAWKRPSVPVTGYVLKLTVIEGLLLVVNSILMYAAIERIPVGIAVAIGFWGPMALALHGSRRPIDVFWVALAITGILLFTPLADASFDTTGVILAILGGVGFAASLVYSSRLGHAVGGVAAAGVALVVGVVALAPFSIVGGLFNHLSADFLWRMAAAAVLASIFGSAIEITALTRIKPSLYAILISTEPAVGAVLGYLILSEHIGWLGAAGIGAVATASIGASRTHGRGKQT